LFYLRQVRRAAGRNEQDEAIRKNALVPTYTLHRLVKERYPRFQDALGDIDDALTLSHLFAALPSTGSIKASIIGKAKHVVAAWGAYCATTCSITKSFISVKGIYLEATVQGQPIRWIVPHSFTQYLPSDVDYRVMQTFFEFYETLLKFVLFKLYNDIGVRYPLSLKEEHAVGSTSSILSSNLRALTDVLSSSEGNISNVVAASLVQNEKPQEPKTKDSKKSKELQKSVATALQTVSDASEDEDEEGEDIDVSGPLAAALESMTENEGRRGLAVDALDDEGLKRKRVFAGLTFFMSREVPRGYLELVVLSFGGSVGWEGDDSPVLIDDAAITHHIVDRPTLPSSYADLPKSREYIQPQWILDCTNNMFILPVAQYAVGVELPPHLSPWVDNEEEGYKPAYAEEIEKMKNGETVIDADNNESASDDRQEPDSSGTDDESSDDEKVVDEDKDKEEAQDNEERLKRKKHRNAEALKRQEEEASALAKSMMNRKAAHLYGRMQHGIKQKEQKIEALQRRREEIDAKQLGKTTMSKAKVERLKKERSKVEEAYSQTGGSMKKRKKGGK
jgi:pescadillo protein